jgi:hypothetical protein
MNITVTIAIGKRLMSASGQGVSAFGASLFLLQHLMIPHIFSKTWIVDGSVSVEGLSRGLYISRQPKYEHNQTCNHSIFCLGFYDLSTGIVNSAILRPTMRPGQIGDLPSDHMSMAKRRE